MPSRSGSRPIVLYDEDCGFCRWTLAKLLAFDSRRRLRPLPIGSAEGQALLSDLSPEQRQASWHLVEASGRRLSAARAAPVLLRELRFGAAPAALLARFPRLAERAYQWVAGHRSAFGRLVPAGAKRRADARIAARS